MLAFEGPASGAGASHHAPRLRTRLGRGWSRSAGSSRPRLAGTRPSSPRYARPPGIQPDLRTGDGGDGVGEGEGGRLGGRATLPGRQEQISQPQQRRPQPACRQAGRPEAHGGMSTGATRKTTGIAAGQPLASTGAWRSSRRRRPASRTTITGMTWQHRSRHEGAPPGGRRRRAVATAAVTAPETGGDGSIQDDEAVGHGPHGVDEPAGG